MAAIIRPFHVPLEPGVRLGAYEVLSLLGMGGMGEVYRARDARLARDVAIKVLPDASAGDPERVARFEREAQLLASLNHPNIAAIYGLETRELDGRETRALVLELVEGPTLADRIAEGPIAVDEAVAIARQIADALEAAHDKGVVHRDLKPANIKLTPDGKVKVLDFGLAKLLESQTPPSSVSMSPTLSIQATFAGMILGTAAYMSPEQARGRQVDKRTDVWAFGCVLYEMLTARRAFPGDDVTDIIAAVVRAEPQWDVLPASVPDPIQLLVRRALDKDRATRLPDIGTARFLLTEPLTLPAAAAPPTVRPSPWRAAISVAAAAAIAAAVTLIAVRTLRSTPPSIVTRFTIPLPQGQAFTNVGRQVLSISRDGSRIVYVANQQLYLRSMWETEARMISGLDGSSAVINPVFSPDGGFLAFWGLSDQSLKKISAAGGAPVTLGKFENPFGMIWTGESIIFGQGRNGIVRIPETGGPPSTIVKAGADEQLHGPQLLPDGDSILFTAAASSTNPDRWDKARIDVVSLKSGVRKTILNPGTDARYIATGHLIYAVSGVLFAVPFDARRLEIRGGAVPVVEGVRRAGPTGTAQFATADNGTLVYVPGPVSTATGLIELALIDRKGLPTLVGLQPGAYDHIRAAPDGKRITFQTDDGKESIVWTYELAGATAMKRLTFGGQNRFPIWTHDGRRVVFQSERDGDAGIYWQPADGTGQAERLTTAEKGTTHIPESWSPKGDVLLYRLTKGDDVTLMALSLADRKSAPFGDVRSKRATNATFSPDGRWVSYASTPTPDPGLNAVYVQPFPATGAHYQVPVLEPGGYRSPHWSADGRELFFMIGGNVRMRSMTVSTQPTFAFGNPAPVEKPPYWLDGVGDIARRWDVTADGHFIAPIGAGSAGQRQVGGQPAQAQTIDVVLNWFDELKQRAPSK